MNRLILTSVSICALIFSSKAFCSADIEPDVDHIEKVYRNGDSIRLSCKGEGYECKLAYKEYGVEQAMKLDFRPYRRKPEMSQVALFRGAEHDHSAIAIIEVRCNAEDVDVLAENIKGAICLLEVHIKNKEIDGTPSLQILPITSMSIYKDIELKGDGGH